jgi:ABC-2 type transport system permease protein
MSRRWPATVLVGSVRSAVADRGGLLVSMGFYAIVTAVLSGLWRAAAESGNGSVAGYDARALTWYVIATEATTVALNIRLIDEVGTQIGDGTVAVELLRPASVLGVRVSASVGRALPRLGVCLVAGAAYGLAVVGPPSFAGALLAVPACLLAICVNLVAQHAFAAMAFWFSDARSGWYLYQKLVFILGGMLLPLQVMPTVLERVALALPFMAMSYAPGRLLAGHVEPLLLVVQLGWLAVLGVLAALVFRSGERRLQVVGG